MERLAAGEIEAELDACTGRWKIHKASLNSSETKLLTEAEVAWRDEKTLLQAELHRERSRADEERERANREQEKAARERERAEGLRRVLKELRPSGPRGGGGGGCLEGDFKASYSGGLAAMTRNTVAVEFGFCRMLGNFSPLSIVPYKILK